MIGARPTWKQVTRGLGRRLGSIIVLGLTVLALADIRRPRRKVTKGIFFLWVAVAAPFGLAAAVVVFSGPVADRILANAISPRDYELPPTAYPARPSSADVQVMGGRGMGLDCSLPWPWLSERLAFPRKETEASISLQMRQACIFHDYCYRHGAATYGYTQADCDFILQEHAFRLCTQINRDRGLARCQTEARKVTLGVRLGGAGSFRHSDFRQLETRDTQQLADDRYATHFEFDPYPVRSKQFTAVRVADAPYAWTRAGAIKRALYVFQIHPWGTVLRVLGNKPDGEALCARLELPAQFRAMAIPPLVVRDASGTDWFVWWRRRTVEATDVLFDGLAPKHATFADWQAIFGEVRTGLDASKDAGCGQKAFAEDTDTSGDRPKASFQRVFAKGKVGDRSDGDPMVSEFHAVPAGVGPQEADSKLLLLGLTTHKCAWGPDRSTCINEVEIDPVAGAGSHEPFRTLDPNCIMQMREAPEEEGGKARFERYRKVFVKAQRFKNGDCDGYRDFASNPIVVAYEGRVGLAWLRRGASNGDGYQETAHVRWASPSNTPKDRHGVDRLWNYRETIIPLPEKAEPVAWLQSDTGGPALFSLQADSRDCPEGLQVNWQQVVFPPRPDDALRETADAGGTGAGPAAAPIGGPGAKHCWTSLGKEWLARPYVVINGRKLVMLRMSLDAADIHDPAELAGRRAWISVEITTATLDGPLPKIARTVPVARAYALTVCRVTSGSDARWTVTAEAVCGKDQAVSYGRARETADVLPILRRAMHAGPIVVTFLDDDDVPGIVLVNPVNPAKAVWIKGERERGDIAWRVVGR